MRKNRNSLYAILLILIATGAIMSCNTPKEAQKTADPCTTIKMTYTADIKPIIDENCGTSCHSASHKAGRIDLSSYETVKNEGLTGNLLPAIQHMEGLTPMPKGKPMLADSSIQKIACWIQSGAVE